MPSQKFYFIARQKGLTSIIDSCRKGLMASYFCESEIQQTIPTETLLNKSTTIAKNCIFAAMESNRQKKVAGVLQKDLAEVLQKALREQGTTGIIISVSKVKVPTDLSIAKVYLSVFPNAEGEKILEEIKEVNHQIRHEISQRTRHQLRRMPELQFYIDDSLEYIDNIEKSLKGEENPLEDPSLLEKRKKK